MYFNVFGSCTYSGDFEICNTKMLTITDTLVYPNTSVIIAIIIKLSCKAEDQKHRDILIETVFSYTECY